MITIDASVLIPALIGEGPLADAASQALARDPVWAAPAHLIVEVASGIRGQDLGRKVSAARAEAAITTLGRLSISLFPVADLLGDMWAIRHRVSSYDAAYLVLAARLGAPLVTADARLARAGGHQVQLIG